MTRNTTYLFSDHLGSSSVVTDANGNYNPNTDRALYTPFGELRGNPPAFLGGETHRGYTGHQENPIH